MRNEKSHDPRPHHQREEHDDRRIQTGGAQGLPDAVHILEIIGELLHDLVQRSGAFARLDYGGFEGGDGDAGVHQRIDEVAAVANAVAHTGNFAPDDALMHVALVELDFE